MPPRVVNSLFVHGAYERLRETGFAVQHRHSDPFSRFTGIWYLKAPLKMQLQIEIKQRRRRMEYAKEFTLIMQRDHP